ncbi:MAG: RND family transporter, partial [Planctomycetaceae bacterium]
DPREWKPDDPLQRTLIAYVELDTGVNGRPRDRKKVQRRRRGAVARMFEVLESAERADVDFHVIGAVVIQHELERMSRRILAIFVPISLLLTFLALGVGFRSWPPVLLAVSAAVWSVTVLTAGIVWAGWTLNVVTVGGPTLMFVIVVATTVHFSHYEADRPAEHHNPAELPPAVDRDARNRHFVRWVGVPCLGAAVTTGFGFLMLAFNELAPTRELGIELCIGAVLAFVGAFVVRLVVPAGRPQQGRWLSPPRLRSLHRLVAHRPGSIVIGTLAVTFALGAVASRIETDPDPFSFFHKESKLARAFDHIKQRQFGMYLVDVVLVPKHRPQDPAQREIEAEKNRLAARRFRKAIERRPEVRSVVSTFQMKARASQLKAESQSIDVADLRRLRAFQGVFENWLTDRAGEDAVRITFKVDDLGDGFSDLMADVRAELPKDRFECIYSGTAADIGVLADGLIGGMALGLGMAFVAMAAVCAFWFRSCRLTVIAVLPNVFPVLFVMGVMGAFNVPLNSGTVMVTTIALGVALNDTVHFIMHYRERRLEGEAVDAALSDTFAEIGRPIVLTSVVNCLGFSIFLLSEFRPMWEFGLMTGIAMLAALLGDLVMLPSLLSVFDRDPTGRKVPEATAADSAGVAG